ncbi:Glutamine amidotransferase [alpha proteobacterium BAL199]|jgi:imidazole glycerol-phosphate synthase subunit HisH|nr:Glutamine amidotransferase [alpha proteobacterium BAL199]
MSTTAIIDYGSGNLRSAANAFERAARESETYTRVTVTDDPKVVHTADRIVLPGVGAFAECRRGLYAVDGMVEALTARVLGDGVPFIGICVGMQLMAKAGYEHVTSDGLGWVDGDVEIVQPAPEPDGRMRKIPHMGWNELRLETVGSRHPVLTGIADGDHAYFVHSYAMTMRDSSQRLASVDYGGSVTAVVARDNLIGTQFHPEKSQTTGLRLIANFLGWRP